MFGFGETGLLRPRWLSDERIAFIGCLVAAALFLWQAVDLEMWTVVGPGPGLFPAITAGVGVVLAALLAVFPALGDDLKIAARDDAPPDASPKPAERRVFWSYCLALPLLVVGTIYLGFIVLSVAVAMLLTWWAEGRNWRAALVFGAGCGVVGIVGFNHYLGVSLPLDALDHMLLRLFY